MAGVLPETTHIEDELVLKVGNYNVTISPEIKQRIIWTNSEGKSHFKR